jgi:phosphonate transport system substrate-binding protein
MKKKLMLFMGLVLMMCLGAVQAAEYKLAIQPILPRAKIKPAYQPLADYLSAKTGETITLATFSSFKSYFANMKREKGFDIVLDAAHFTDYRIQRMDYTVLAKIPDTVSFSLVTGPELFVFDAEELIPYKVATMISPALGGLRLKELYPDREKTPTFVRASDSADAVNQVLNGKADAAMIPTPLVGNYENLNTVLTTEPLPHTAFSVSPKVPQAIADTIKKALIDAVNTKEGREMLSKLGFAKFDPATNGDYAGYADILNLTKRNKPTLSR